MQASLRSMLCKIDNLLTVLDVVVKSELSRWVGKLKKAEKGELIKIESGRSLNTIALLHLNPGNICAVARYILELFNGDFEIDDQTASETGWFQIGIHSVEQKIDLNGELKSDGTIEIWGKIDLRLPLIPSKIIAELKRWFRNLYNFGCSGDEFCLASDNIVSVYLAKAFKKEALQTEIKKQFARAVSGESGYRELESIKMEIGGLFELLLHRPGRRMRIYNLCVAPLAYEIKAQITRIDTRHDTI